MKNKTYKRVLILSTSIISLSLFSHGNLANAQNTFSHSMEFESSKLPYNWHTSGWNACAGECNLGIQDRDVGCKDNAGNPAPSEASCNHTQKPEITRQCELPDCQWVVDTCSHEHTETVNIVISGGFDGGGCCFIAGTKITMADGSLKNIEDIVEGDEVIGLEGAVHTVQGTVISSLKERTLISINGGDFFSTSDHVFKTPDGWASADPETTNKNYPDIIEDIGGMPDKMAIGMTLLGKDGPVEIETLEHKKESADLPVYDFEVDKTHTYIANDYVVHNQSGGCPPNASTEGGGGGGGAKVLCGHYFNRGILSHQIYMGDLAFAQTDHINAATVRGYHAWAIPLTRYLNNNHGGIVEKLVQPLVLGWAQEMAFKTGYATKGSLLGKALLSLVPATTLLGRFVKEQDPTVLLSEQQAKHKLYMQRQAEIVTKSYNDYRLAYAA